MTISRAFRRREFSYSLGAGPVFAYPINKVRGQALTHDRGVDGYLLSGGSVMAMATRNLPLTRRLIVSLDVRGSASIVPVPVVNGHATVPNAAMHFHLGLGYRLGQIRKAP